MISFEYLNIPHILSIGHTAKEFIGKIIRTEKRDSGDITFIFTDNPTLLDINKKFLNHHYFTDVITFSENRKRSISGDIFISLDQVKLNSEENKTGFISEVCRVMVHGILHMAGYNDATPSEKKIMREKEDEYLCQFNWKDVIIDREA